MCSIVCFCGLGVCFCVQQRPIILSCLSWIRLGTNVGLGVGVFVWRRSRFGKDCFELYELSWIGASVIRLRYKIGLLLL